MKKVLFIATVDSHIELFHLSFLKMFKENGYEVHVATESNKSIKYCDKKIKLPIKRSPFKLVSNFKATRVLRKILAQEKYDIIHCHTPVGGVVARMAAKKVRKNGTRVIYTAHGFHFYKGAPLIYWVLFYPVEKYLAKFTDTLITINDEDFERAKKRFSGRCSDIQYVPGVGVDVEKFKKKMTKKEKMALRKTLGLKEDDKVLICVGRLDKNKNQGELIRAMKKMSSKHHLLLAGPDEFHGKYQKLAEKLGVSSRVHFLGFREDISNLLQISDLVVSASKREGLPVNLIEAKIIGVPIKASDCRGNRDVTTGDVEKFSLERVKKEMEKIYQKTNDNKIDFVVLWVDGADPNWLKKKSKYTDKTDLSARYRDWGTFKYWFRAVEKYAPWVNHVYLVTDNQKPEWINENHPKLKIIDHKEIIDSKYLPTFNSQAIEMNLHKIPGLSEHFVYFNDDVFIVDDVKPTDFFRNGLPVEIANINAATGIEGDQLYAQTMFNNILLINRNFKKREVVHKHLLKWLNPKYGSFNLRTLTQMPYPYFTGFKPKHTFASLLKSTFDEIWKKEKSILEKTSSHRFRHPDDVNQNIFSQWQLCKNQFIPGTKSKGKHIQLRIPTDLRNISKSINARRIKTLCINDGVNAELSEVTIRRMMVELKTIFEKKFPEASKYEK